MLADVVAAFRCVDLGVGAEKTHWTSAPGCLADKIKVEGCSIDWESSLTFVGMILDFTGTSWPAIRHRMAQGMAAWRRWAPLLTAPWLSMRRKMELLGLRSDQVYSGEAEYGP